MEFLITLSRLKDKSHHYLMNRCHFCVLSYLISFTLSLNQTIIIVLITLNNINSRPTPK